MTIDNDFDVLSLDNCRLRTHIVIPKTIVKDIPLLNSCIVLQSFAILVFFLAKFKFFWEGYGWWNNWAGNCLLGRYWPQVKSKFKMPLQLAMAFWITMQCNARAIYCFFHIQNMPPTFETTREPRSILPLAPILQRHLPSNASLNIEVGQQRVISLKVLPQCHLSK